MAHTNHLEDNPKELIVELIADNGSPKQMQQLLSFYNTPKASDEVKMFIIQSLLSFNDEDKASTLVDLLLKNPPKRSLESSYYVFFQLEDSLDLAKTQAQKLSALYNNPDFKDQLVDLYANQILNQPDAADSFKSLQEKIIAEIRENIKKYNDTLKRNNSNYLNIGLINNYILMAERDPAIAATPSGEILRLIYQQNEPENWVVTRALLKAINMSYTIDPTILNRYLKNYYSRYEVMEALAMVEVPDLIPTSYLQADEFSYLCVYNAVGAYDDDYSHPITKLGMIQFEGKDYVVYQAVLNNGIEDIKALFAAAYQDADPKTMEFVPVYSNPDWATPNIKDWQQLATQIIKEGLINEDMYSD